MCCGGTHQGLYTPLFYLPHSVESKTRHQIKTRSISFCVYFHDSPEISSLSIYFSHHFSSTSNVSFVLKMCLLSILSHHINYSNSSRLEPLVNFLVLFILHQTRAKYKLLAINVQQLELYVHIYWQSKHSTNFRG